jgi:hypothetical protein
LERNGDIGKYNNRKIIYYANKAQKRYLERRKESKEGYRIIENNYLLEEKLIYLITEKKYSPEQIAGRFNILSFKTIYQ